MLSLFVQGVPKRFDHVFHGSSLQLRDRSSGLLVCLGIRAVRQLMQSSRPCCLRTKCYQRVRYTVGSEDAVNQWHKLMHAVVKCLNFQDVGLSDPRVKLDWLE